MHGRIRIAFALELAALALAAVPASAATIPSVPTKNGARYINPFADPAWGVSRTDMGVDWVPAHRLAVLALGDAVILGSDNHSPWPGKHLIYSELPHRRLAADVISVAAHLKNLLPSAPTVKPGPPIA